MTKQSLVPVSADCAVTRRETNPSNPSKSTSRHRHKRDSVLREVARHTVRRRQVAING